MAPQKTNIITLIFVFVLVSGASYHVGAKPDHASGEHDESDRVSPSLTFMLVRFIGNTMVVSLCVAVLMRLAPWYYPMLALSLVPYNLAQIHPSLYERGPVWLLLLMLGFGISGPLLLYLYRRFYNPVPVNGNV